MTYNRRNNFTSYKRSKYDFCKENLVDYKDASLLRKFITDRGRIDAGIKSGNSAKCHREVTKAIKRARYLALLPYAPQHERVTGPVKIFEINEKPSNETEIKDSNVDVIDDSDSKSPDNEVVKDANTTSDDNKTS
ncbi:MAG: 30S ribosomal protein S18 [Chloroflexi bacterium]|nr:30S ribosomal protein S18 [Chloroflexota bacterium]